MQYLVAEPFCPLGMSDMTRPDPPAALGMRAPGREFLAVWRRNGPEDVCLPIHSAGFRLLYPCDLGIRVMRSSHGIHVRFPSPEMGCILST
ncbi:MAG TPA: hypothetical protein VGS10_19080 [Terracidiphilus sp.]|nr:hypothetical protein [Terracidiphilus sp.]